jgi:ABC-type transporter Mla maintaining outer membrane lipid asymmetry ATPase subunit MlaF
MSEVANPDVIEMRDVDVGTMRDDSHIVVKGVNWSVMAGDFWVVGGQQYSGKSDLLMLAGGLMGPAAGISRVYGIATQDFGEDHLAERLRIGFVFQGGQLFNRLTVAENVALPLRYQENLSPAETASIVGGLLEILELTPLADVTPGTISVNWRLRVALARALVLKPELLLLDNPFTGLGVRHWQWLLRFLEQLWHGHEWLARRPMTLVVTTDDLRLWESPARKFALLHEKTFARLGSWGEIVKNKHPAVRELLAETIETKY